MSYTATASLLPSVITRSSTDVPDQLYNLEIRQYDADGNHLTGKDYGTVDIGKSLEVTLQEADDCQLVLVARGSGPAVSALETKTLERDALCASFGACKSGYGQWRSGYSKSGWKL